MQPSDDLPTTCDGVEKSKVLADATVLEMPCAKNPWTALFYIGAGAQVGSL